MDFKGLNVDDTLNKLGTSVKGLNHEEVLKRQKKYGLNTYYFSSEFLKLFLIQIFNPIVLLLFVAFILSINLNYINIVIISLLILINITSNIALEYKNNYPINFEKLRKKVTVIRDGRKIKINSKNITIGDIIIIEKNHYIPADIKIIVGNDIEVKSPLNNVHNDNNILLAGDYVVSGGGMGAVYNIGKNTEIHKLSNKISQNKKQKLPFKSFTNNLNKKIFIFSILIILFEFLILCLKKCNYTYLTDSLIKTIISLNPMCLIMMLVLTLFYFKKKEKNIKINSLNSLGSISDITTLICKKNILTINQITAKTIILEDGSIYEIEGSGYNDVGEIIPINPSAKYKDSLYNLSLLGKLIYLNNKASLKYEENKWIYSGNDYDIADLSLNKKINNMVFENKVIQEIKNEDYIIYFYKEDEITHVSIKGKIKKILEFCNNNQDEILEKYDYLKSNGYEVIGVCEGTIKNKKKYSEKDVKNLNFLGLIGYINPLKENVKDEIEKLKNKGINVIVVSDDNENNTEILGKELKLISKRKEISNSTDINHNFNLGERVFDSLVKEIKMLSNVSNDDLIKVTNSLKKQGEIIGIISNDENDLEVINNVHISISDNDSVIKNVCDFNICNLSLELIDDFITNGSKIKKIVLNMINYLLYSNIIIVFIIFLSSIFNSFSLSIIQILLINLISFILVFIPILSNNNYNDCNYTKKIVLSQKGYLKWILQSIFNGVITYIYVLILNKLDISISSIIFMISLLNVSLLFYYEGNTIFNLRIKDNFKFYLFITIFLLIVLILLKFIYNVTSISIFIAISLSLIPIFVIECMKKVDE